MIIINIDEKEVKAQHVCYYIVERGKFIELHEVREVFYNHPDSDGYALIQRTETRLVRKESVGSFEAAALYLLLNAEQNLIKIERYNSLIKE